jgi:2-octaprenylphenol hydroxylase
MPREQPLKLVVVGAGPVGLLLAARLMRDPVARRFQVRVIDAQSLAGWQESQTDPRVYALSRASQLLFGESWSSVAAHRISPYRRMRVWAGDSPVGSASIGFDAADIGEPDLGHIVEDSLLRRVLLDELAGAPVEISLGVGVDSLTALDGRVSVTMSDGEHIDADLVVGADGAQSMVRSATGIRAISKNYHQRAVVSHVTTEKYHQETAWQRFLPDGPLAFLPLADGRSSIVWTNSEAEADRLVALDDDAFIDALATASGGVLGRPVACSRRIAFPLRLTHAIDYVRPGVALIGDAAHAVHPLAGQGMNLGLRDAAVLADTLIAAITAGEYLADERVLKRYERAQKAHNLGMQLAFDGLNELFGRRVPAWARPIGGFGLGLVDRIAPAKQLLMRQALGVDSMISGAKSGQAA